MDRNGVYLVSLSSPQHASGPDAAPIPKEQACSALQNFSFALTSPDAHADGLFATYSRALAGISIDRLRQAGELVGKADKARQGKRVDEARSLYAEALRHNPYHHRALYELGMDAHRRRDTAAVERYFSVLERVFPDPKYARPRPARTR